MSVLMNSDNTELDFPGVDIPDGLCHPKTTAVENSWTDDMHTHSLLGALLHAKPQTHCATTSSSETTLDEKENTPPLDSHCITLNYSEVEDDVTWFLGQQPDNHPAKMRKPPYTFKQLIVEALVSKENKQLSFEGIYDFIQTRYPYYGTSFMSKRSKASITCVLQFSVNYFKRVPSTSLGAVWTLHPAYEAELMKNAIKDSNGEWRIHFEPRTTLPKKKTSSRNKRKPSATARAKLLPSKFKCRICEALHDDLSAMKQHVVENHGNQQALRPKMHQDRMVKQKMLGEVDTLDVINDFDIRSLSTVVKLCLPCNKYISEREIVIHLNSHSPSNKCVVCDTCGEQFQTKVRWRKHKILKHGPTKLFTCDICQACFSYRSALKYHMDKNHGIEKCHQCEICGKNFGSKGLKQHLAIHMTVKPWQCPECDKGFAKKTNMDSHRRIHTGDKPYKCDMCTQAFTHNVSLKRHKKKAHGIDMWANK